MYHIIIHIYVHHILITRILNTTLHFSVLQYYSPGMVVKLSTHFTISDIDLQQTIAIIVNFFLS